MEIRGHDTHKLGEPIYLLESGSHRVRGTCKITGTVPITEKNWDKLRNRHCVDISFQELSKRYHAAYAWELAEVEAWEDVSYYEHPKGAVIWIKNVELSDEIAENKRLRYGY